MDIFLPPDVAKELEEKPPTRDDVDSIGTLAEDDDKDYFIDRTGQKYSRQTGLPLAPEEKPDGLTFEAGKKIFTRCPHIPTAAKMAACIQRLRAEEDSTGGVCTCVITGTPVGLGEPCFDKLEAQLALAMMSLPATKAFEIGEGFNACKMRGSQHNDLFTKGGNNLLHSKTNHAGGTLGGISTGEPIVMRIGIKPASSISQDQSTATFGGEAHVLSVKGRHDPCVLPRAPPLVEGMAAITVADAAMRQRARQGGPLQILTEADVTMAVAA